PLLTKQGADVPLLVLISSRYDEHGRSPTYPLAPDTPTLTINLRALPPVTLRNLAQETMGMNIDEQLHDLLITKAQGNPLFAQQILYYLRDNQYLPVTAITGKPTATLSLDTFNLPPTLNSLLVARLDRLTQKVKEVVQTAAVLGRQFDSYLLSQMLHEDIDEALFVAEQAQIWTQLNTREYIFKHALLCDAAYEMQLRTQLRQLHYLAAETSKLLYASALPLYFVNLAHHYETAYHFGLEKAQEWARHYLVAAGHQSLNKFEHDAAIDYFSRALALTSPKDSDKRLQLLLAREETYDMQGNREAQGHDLAQLAALSPALDMTNQTRIALRQANYAEATGDYAQAIVCAQTAVQKGQLSGETGLVSEGYWEWGMALWRQGHHAQALKQFQTGTQLVQEGDNPKQLASCLHGLGNISLYHGEYIAAKEYYEQAIAIRRQLGDRYGEELSLNNYGVVVRRQGDYAAAQTCHQQTLAFCREIGDRRGEGMNLSNLGHIAMNQGDHKAAKTYFEQALAIRREIGDPYGEGISLNELGALALAQGQLALAETYYTQALTIRQDTNQPHHLVEDWAGLARLKLAQVEQKEAARYAQQVLDYLEENPHLDGTINAMRVFHFLWDVLMALDLIAAAQTTLQLAAEKMQIYLSQNDDPGLQEMYLRQLHHRVLWAAWVAHRNEQA
ncbi:MAG: tetratricopeptide repeat protein, partial [Anaerolineales bacterium]|nr:tetratricopeptide repeat protein [Anaerolineales bacterium]